MRLNSLLGLAGLRRKEKAPEAKRYKRLDVLDSLGIGQSACAHPPTPSSSSAKTAVQSLSGSSSDKEELRKWLAGEDFVAAGHVSAADPPADENAEAAAAAAAAGTEADAAAAQDAAARGAVPDAARDETAVAAEQTMAAPKPDASARPVIKWRQAFTKAQDRWAVAEGGARCFYHLSDKGLFFEWDQEAGLLFQYFFGAGEARSVPVGDDELPERGPIWSSECPDTHAEVWEVLPLPPTDASAKAADTKAQDELQAPSSTEGAGTTSQFEMAPPPMKKRKKALPPVPVMAPAASAAGADDDDDDDLHLPGEAEPTQVLGCEGPPPPASSSSAGPSEPEEEEEDIAGSFVLDDGEEAADLASEDCALPAAPADKAEPAAADLDLDMFADM